MMKKLIYILLIGFFACKSTKTNTNNQLDITKEAVEKTENTITVSQLSLDDFEITFHTANEKLPVKITDATGNTQKFENVKSATLKKKTAQKKDSVIKENNTVREKLIDKSKIKEVKESVSDSKNVKSIFSYLLWMVVLIALIYLVYKFKT